MDDRKIFECVAKIPWIRAVQISDMLDTDLAEVSNALRELVETGELVRKAGFAPNGVSAQCYDFSPSFKATNDYKVVMAAVAPPVAAEPSQAEVAIGAKAGEAQSRAERALELIKKTGGATDDEIRAELGLKQTEYPSGILGHAMKAGKVTRRGNRWVPGDGRPMMDPPAAPPFSIGKASAVDVPSFLSERAKPGPKPSGGAGKPKTVVAPAAAPEPVPAPNPAAFRCGLWSDGLIELQRAGRTVIELRPDEGETLFEFLQRVPAMQVSV